MRYFLSLEDNHILHCYKPELNMVHKLARKHFLPMGAKSYPVTLYGDDPHLCYLNLNINSLSSDPYKFYPELKNDALARRYLEILGKLSQTDRSSLCLKEENILFTQGSAEAIDLIIRVFCEPQKESILITSPTFPYYSYRASIENVTITDIPLLGENYNRLNTEAILASTAKVLFLCSPNNPVGTVLDPDEVKKIIEGFAGIVVLDEAYVEWTDRKSYVEWVQKYENLIVLRTFSKIWGLAGVRCGIVIAQKGAIDALRLSQTLFSFPQSSVDLLMAKMDEVDKIMDYKREMIELREDFCQFLENQQCVKKIYPGEGNFLLIKFHDAHKTEKHLLNKKILTSNASNQVAETLRVSIGSSEEMVRLKSALKEMEYAL